MGNTLADWLFGVRDRALLLIGFAGACRRSELVGLDVRDVQASLDPAMYAGHRLRVGLADP